MADRKIRNVHPNEIALADTAAYNERFQTLVDLRKLIQDNPDDPKAVEYESRMHNIVAEVEDFFSDDTTEANIEPLLNMWEVEGKKSFGTFAPDMLDNERAEALDLLHTSGGANLNLSKEQSAEFIADIDAKKEDYEKAHARSQEWSIFRNQNQNKMTGLWHRYQDLTAADPDNDFLGESRAVWWGWATPDNEIQKEIAAGGVEYRKLSAQNMAGAPPGALQSIEDRAEGLYISALEALNKLQGE